MSSRRHGRCELVGLGRSTCCDPPAVESAEDLRPIDEQYRGRKTQFYGLRVRSNDRRSPGRRPVGS